ncbi:MAG: amidohydrolase [Spirochaetaceae bacterium]|nr:MAG: amidohydrolase [Spirochaetaceae bacterium]
MIEWLDQNDTQFIELADAIWRTPEVAWHEFTSSKLQAVLLEEHGFRIRWDVGGISTAFVAEWGEGRPIIGVLGEYDALAGLSQKLQTEQEPLVEGAPGHGCGHNLLGTGGVATAVAVRRWLETSGTRGTIRYYGCPAEEQLSGKTFMAREGAFDDLDAALNFHPDKLNCPSKGSAVGVYDLVFRFRGRTAHAGGSPHLGRSALDAVELMNVGANYLREHVTEKVRIHYVITDGGRLPNVVPETADVWYFVRAHERSELDSVAERLKKVADGAALMTETTCTCTFRGACSNVLSNVVLADAQYANMEELGPIEFTSDELEYAARVNSAFPEEDARTMFTAMRVPAEWRDRVSGVCGRPLIGENFPAWDEEQISTGSTDVGDVSWITPLSMLRTACFATASPGHSWAIVATAGMSIGHKGMMHAAKTMAATAYDLYTKPDLLAAARAEHARATEGHPYSCPIPDEIPAPRVANPVRGVQ